MSKPLPLGHVLVLGFLAMLLAVVAASALLGIWMIVTGTDNEPYGSLLGTGAMSVGYLVLLTAAALVIRARKLPVTMMVAIALAIAGFFGFFTVIWWERSLHHDDEEFLVGLAMTATVPAIALVHAGWFARLKSKSAALRWARWVVVAIVSVCGAMLLTAFWAYQLGLRLPEFLMFGLFQVTFILGLIGTISVPLLIVAAARREAARTESINKRKITMTCPRCAFEQELSTGPCWCAKCRFTMIIQIEEPRCECGYLLFKLEGHSCPECGRDLRPIQI